MHSNTPDAQPTLVLGGTGKTGRRVVERLQGRGLPVRIGSRSGRPAFDWEDRTTWAPALDGVRAVYLTYYPDLALPGAVEATRAFADLAVRRGVPRIVLLSGRGEPEAERAERAVRETGAELTILRSSWFMQNFSEDYMREHVVSGEIRLPAGDVPTPFVDADDIADVAVAALTDDRHVGELYERTGPRSLTMADAAAEIARAAGRDVRNAPVSIEQHEAEARDHGVPPEVIELLTYLFREVVDGRNADMIDGVRRALGREPRDFADFARDATARGAWAEPRDVAARKREEERTMADVGQTLENPASGERITFRRTAAQTNGDLVAIDLELPAGRRVPGPLHIHPEQEERFAVVHGTMRSRLGRRHVVAGPGDVVVARRRASFEPTSAAAPVGA